MNCLAITNAIGHGIIMLTAHLNEVMTKVDYTTGKLCYVFSGVLSLFLLTMSFPDWTCILMYTLVTTPQRRSWSKGKSCGTKVGRTRLWHI